MIKTLILAGIVVGIIVFIRHYNEYDDEKPEPERSPMDQPVFDLDDVLTSIFGDCFEAFCEDCDLILATGTGPYKVQVSNVAYVHGELYDHEVKVRSWAE